MLRSFLLCLCCILLTFRASAQGENNVWTFGNHNGLNFNSGSPVFFQSSNVSLEGCASVSDAAGNLLFYSNGNNVWDASGAVMPNGSGILGNGSWLGIPGSCTQGVAIIKSVANNSQYYLFVLDAAEDFMGPSYPGYLRYSVVDMSLNGGSGDVLPAQKNIYLDTAMSEKMTVTRGIGCSYWLVAHRNNSAAYRSFKIDFSGIHPGITSNGIWTGDAGAGELKFSPDGKRIATANTYQGSSVEMADFDKATGILSNFVNFGASPLQSNYGVSFSPDNSKLYVGMFSGSIFQYDLNLMPNTTAMVSSRYTVSSGYQFSGMRISPDNKIYVAMFQNTPFIACINNPNSAGNACNFNVNALPQPVSAQFTAIAGNPYGHGLGNAVVVTEAADTVISPVTDTLICLHDSVKLSAPADANSYTWNDGSTAPYRYITQSGTYWVSSMSNCSIQIDTFKMSLIDVRLNLGPDTAICINGQLLLDAGNTDATYTWQDGSTAPTLLVTGAGSYSVQVSKEGCFKSDTILISVFEPSLDIPQHDTTICDDENITLKVTANPPSHYLWSNGSTQEQIIVTGAGTYKVAGTNACGTFRDSVKIEMEHCACKAFIPNAFSPNGDQHNDEYRVRTNCNATDFSLSIFNRFGQRIFQTTSPDKGWNGSFNGQPSDVGTYFFFLKYKGPRGDLFERKGDLALIR